ncbi:MAG: hypothetical protein CMF98_07205 [Candidatus Marinimicrobia bacterium]|nr:hypothetical protein [Candidatus Neomarinimicrobiota bacterium]
MEINSNQQKSILITGESGFIGRYLSDSYKNQKNINLIKVTRENGFDLNSDTWVKKLPNIKIDTVIHLAQSNYYNEIPKKAKNLINININSTIDLLEWSKNNSVKKFIYASSGNVYSQSRKKLIENSLLGPSSLYGISKLAGEEIVKKYNNSFDTLIMRIFGVYGPGQKKMLIPEIIKKIKLKNEIFLAQSKGLYFTPIYIDDLINIIRELINRNFNQKNLVVNICGSEVVSLNDLVKKLEKLINKKAKIKITNDEIKYFIGSNELLLKLLNIKDLISLDKGLKLVI